MVQTVHDHPDSSWYFCSSWLPSTGCSAGTPNLLLLSGEWGADTTARGRAILSDKFKSPKIYLKKVEWNSHFLCKCVQDKERGIYFKINIIKNSQAIYFCKMSFQLHPKTVPKTGSITWMTLMVVWDGRGAWMDWRPLWSSPPYMSGHSTTVGYVAPAGGPLSGISKSSPPEA